jgi:hypothetical protein
MRLHGSRFPIGVLALALSLTGCDFGPLALENTHGRYNESLKQVDEEQLLLNIVRARYNDNPMRLDVSAIAAQYELSASAEARPFFEAPNPAGAVFRTFTRILPDVSASATNRPTISLTPLDDPETLRGLFTQSTLDGIIFLAETGYPVATMFRTWVDYLNGLPNAATASGPPRAVVPEFIDFQRVAQIMQFLQDRGDLRFTRAERFADIGDHLPESAITASSQVEAARNGYEYQRRADNSWALVKRERRLDLRLNPRILNSPEVIEFCRLLHLKPGRDNYEIKIDGTDELFATPEQGDTATKISLFPRSPVQAFYYLAHGVDVPPEHFACGVVEPTAGPDGTAFDWSQVTAGLFTVHYAKQFSRPNHAYVAVKYRDYWFYIDDCDHDTKITFSLALVLGRVNLLGTKKGGPALTLPVGR